MPPVTRNPAKDSATPRDLFFPVLLIGIAITIWFAYQSIHLLQEKTMLSDLRTAQEPVLMNAQKMRSQLEALAGGTAGLALQGNPNALQIVEEFRKRGITLNPGNAAIITPVGP